jgi:hypothetical protein
MRTIPAKTGNGTPIKLVDLFSERSKLFNEHYQVLAGVNAIKLFFVFVADRVTK